MFLVSIIFENSGRGRAKFCRGVRQFAYLVLELVEFRR